MGDHQPQDYGRKRPAEEGGHDDPNKRAHTDMADKPYAMKILVSNKDAGTVIGRAGSTIMSIQNKSGSRIRVSNNAEYYPGTQDRVVLVSGEVPAVVSGCQLVLTEVFLNAESLQNNPEAHSEGNIISLNLLIPNAAAGHIIGKGGENIRKMVEDSGAKIQLSSKEKQIPGIDERVLTCVGTVQQIIKATELVAMKVCEDPNIRFQNLTTNYKNFGGPPMGMPPRGGYGGPPPHMPPYGGGGGYDPYRNAYPDPYGGPPPPPQYPGYGGPPPGGAPPSYDGYQAPYAPPPTNYSQPPAGGYSQAPTYDTSAYSQSQYGGGYSAPAAAPAPPPAPTTDASGNVTYSLHVPDHVVPAILGRGGAVIKDMMEQSGATIKVSQKGEYAPGTTNRVISIIGSQHAASYAHQLVSAKIPQA